MTTALFAFSIVVGGLCFGLLCQSYLKIENAIRLRKVLQRCALLFLNPIAFLSAIWIVPLQSFELVLLPFLGAIVIWGGACLAWFIGRHMSRLDRPVFVICGGFTNIGNLGSFFTFLLLGEVGLAFIPFIKLFEELSYYAFGFPYAKSFSDVQTEASSVNRFQIFREPTVLISLSAIALGILLNLTDVERPLIFSEIVSFAIPLSTFFLLFAIGLSLHFGRMKPYLWNGFQIVLIKNIFIPIIVLVFCFLTGFINNIVAVQALMVVSFMPVALIATVPASLYGLNLDMANTCWFVSSLALFVTIPILIWLLPVLGRLA